MLFTEIHKELGDKLPFLLATVGYSESQIAIERPQGFPYHEFLWVREGEGSFIIDGKALTLSAGQGVFLRNDVPRSYRGEHFATMWLTFRCDSGLLEAAGVGRYLVFDTPPALCAQTLRLCERIRGGASILERSGEGYRIVCATLATITAHSLRPAERAYRFLETGFHRPIALEEVAAAAGVDRFALCKVFKEAYGCTVMDCLRQIRVQNAAELLRLSGLSVAEIGGLCGFESPSYFAANFKREMGESPQQYRKKCINLR